MGTAATTGGGSAPPRRVGRALALGAALAAAAIAIAGPTSAQAAPLPPQGLYDQCEPRSDCGPRLRAMASAGFSHVLNYTAWYGSAQQIRRYADQAAAAGVKLIWPLNHYAWRDQGDLIKVYRYLSPDCGCTDNAGFRKYAIDLVKNHPATWGFYIGDELLPTAGHIAQVRALSQEVKRIAPGKPTLYIALPRQSLTAQLGPFVPFADFAGADFYPVGMGDNVGATASVAATTRRLAAAQGRRTALVLQAFSWSQYIPQKPARFPTRGEMRRMRDLAIRKGNPDLLLWYSYNDLAEFSRPGANWANLRTAAFSPHIRVKGRKRCSARRLRVTVKVRTATKLRRVKVVVDGRRKRAKAKRRIRVSVGAKKGRRHRVRVVAIDRSGRRSKHKQKVKGC